MNLKNIFTGLMLTILTLVLIPSLLQASDGKWTFYAIELYDQHLYDQWGNLNKDLDRPLQTIDITAESFKFKPERNKLVVQNAFYRNSSAKGWTQSLYFSKFELELPLLCKTVQIVEIKDSPKERFLRAKTYQRSLQTGKFELSRIEIGEEGDDGHFEIVKVIVFVRL